MTRRSGSKSAASPVTVGLLNSYAPFRSRGGEVRASGKSQKKYGTTHGTTAEQNMPEQDEIPCINV